MNSIARRRRKIYLSGTDKNLVEAYTGLTLFLAQDHRPHLEEARKLASKIAATLTPRQLADARRRAEDWRPVEQDL